MKGPFFTKEDGEFKLIKCCKDCAFANYGKSDKDTECLMISCPCMPPDDEEESK